VVRDTTLRVQSCSATAVLLANLTRTNMAGAPSAEEATVRDCVRHRG
jgi:hypothetical protein